MTPLWRCKHIKRGDGGVVDGCGWQGRLTGSTCPECGSGTLRLIRGVKQAKEHDGRLSMRVNKRGESPEQLLARLESEVW